MKLKNNLEGNENTRTSSFCFSLLFSLSIIIISDTKWIIDEYIYNKNCYSIFYKLISFGCNTKGAIIFYWVYPLIASLPYFTWRSKKREFVYEVNGIIKEAVQAFVMGGLIIFLSYFFDYYLLSLFSKTTFPVPNSLISGYCSNNIFSELYYSNPRLFFLIRGIIGFFFGGAFSLLYLNIYLIFRNIIYPYVLLEVLYFIEELLSYQLNVVSWKDVLYADNYRCSSIMCVLLNFFSIILVGIIIHLVKRKTFRFRENSANEHKA